MRNIAGRMEPLPVDITPDGNAPFDIEEPTAQTDLLRMEEILAKGRGLSALNAIAVLYRSLDLHAMLSEALDKTLELLEVEGGLIQLWDKERGTWGLRVQRSRCQGLTGKLALKKFPPKGGPLVIGDLAKDARAKDFGVTAEGYRSLAAIRLTARGKPVGVLAAFSISHETFRERDVQLLASVGRQAERIGIVIGNSRLLAEMRRLAITDDLTGLYNYRQLSYQLDVEFSRAMRYGRQLSLIMLDIDLFKGYNDRYGHLVGDQALRQVAEVLRKNVRKADVVARYGGEEFSVILPETGLSQALVQAERIRSAIAEHPFPADGAQDGKRLTVSLGAASLTSQMQGIKDLIQAADEALYRAKAGGRNRVCPIEIEKKRASHLPKVKGNGR